MVSRQKDDRYALIAKSRIRRDREAHVVSAKGRVTTFGARFPIMGVFGLPVLGGR